MRARIDHRLMPHRFEHKVPLSSSSNGLFFLGTRVALVVGNFVGDAWTEELQISTSQKDRPRPEVFATQRLRKTRAGEDNEREPCANCDAFRGAYRRPTTLNPQPRSLKPVRATSPYDRLPGTSWNYNRWRLRADGTCTETSLRLPVPPKSAAKCVTACFLPWR